MSRGARVVIPGHIYHVTQRGNNRQYIFDEEEDYILYLKRAEEYRIKFDLDIFAYCLMGNHVHFIIRPNRHDSLARMFRGVNMRYAQYFQKKTSGCGHVWQGRFYSCLLCGGHLKEAIRYVENNPVRAKMVLKPWHYSWSSARFHIGKVYKWITLCDIKDIIEEDNWKRYLEEGESESLIERLREMTKKNLVLGPKEFIKELEGKICRRIMPNVMGRPKSKSRVRP